MTLNAVIRAALNSYYKKESPDYIPVLCFDAPKVEASVSVDKTGIDAQLRNYLELSKEVIAYDRKGRLVNLGNASAIACSDTFAVKVLNDLFAQLEFNPKDSWVSDALQMTIPLHIFDTWKRSVTSSIDRLYETLSKAIDAKDGQTYSIPLSIQNSIWLFIMKGQSALEEEHGIHIYFDLDTVYAFKFVEGVKHEIKIPIKLTPNASPYTMCDEFPITKLMLIETIEKETAKIEKEYKKRIDALEDELKTIKDETYRKDLCVGKLRAKVNTYRMALAENRLNAGLK